MTDVMLAESLADIALEAADALGSDAVEAAAVRTLVDWFGVAVGGAESPAARALLTALGARDGDVRLLGSSGRRVSAETAALIHGTAAHALELDDIYAPGIYHPGAPTIAAALAAAERFDMSGRDFVRGVVAGIEIGCRVAADLGATHYRHWHTTGTVGTIGAAVAVAVMRGAARAHVAQAIAVSGTMAAGLQQTFRRDGVTKPLHSGHAAQSGLIAALGAIEGLTGALDILEGASGLAAATGVTTPWDVSRAPLDSALCIENLTVKPYPCCGHTFAAIDAAIELHARGIRPDDVASLTVETYTTAIDTAGIPAPNKPSEARFSIPFTVATALEAGRVTQDSFAQARVIDPHRAEFLPRVTLRAAADFDGAFPARRGARVVAELVSGERLTAQVADRLGSPQNPIGSSALDAKFDDLVVPGLGEQQSAELRRAISGILTLPSIRDLPLTRLP